MCKRTKQLREFIEQLPLSFRLKQRDSLQEQRNVERSKSYESRMGSESLKKRAIALGVM